MYFVTRRMAISLSMLHNNVILVTMEILFSWTSLCKAVVLSFVE